MKPAFYAGATGLLAYQEALNVVGNNLANANTVGYKSQGVSFENLLYNRMYTNTQPSPLTGHGTRAVDTGLIMGQAPMSNTNSPLDFAIAGDGFFGVENGGRTEYTKNGAFIVRIDGDRGYLATQDGKYVLSQDNRRIELEVEAVKDSSSYNYDKVKEQIGVFRFKNPSGLEPRSSTAYAPTVASGTASAVTDDSCTIRQNCLELSGTSVVDEMTALISAQRGYQISARVIQTADEIEQIINSLRK